MEIHYRLALPVANGQFCRHFGRASEFLLCDVEQDSRIAGRTRSVVKRLKPGECESVPEWLKSMGRHHDLGRRSRPRRSAPARWPGHQHRHRSGRRRADPRPFGLAGSQAGRRPEYLQAGIASHASLQKEAWSIVTGRC